MWGNPISCARWRRRARTHERRGNTYTVPSTTAGDDWVDLVVIGRILSGLERPLLLPALGVDGVKPVSKLPMYTVLPATAGEACTSPVANFQASAALRVDRVHVPVTAAEVHLAVRDRW